MTLPAPKSVHDRHALLHAILKYGVRRHVIPNNPAVETDLPRKRKGQPKGLRPLEWAALHAALKQLSPDAADLAEFLLASGWRWSEATALTTYDVEDDGERVWVTMSHVVRRGAGGYADVEDGKSEAAMRRVQLGTSTARMVRDRVSRVTPGGYVFTPPASPYVRKKLRREPGGIRWSYGNFRDRYWEKAVDAANLQRRPTPHWLRHTSVVWLLQHGGTMPEVQARIGHESITTTIGTYGRMIQDVQPRALEAFDHLVGGPPGLASAAHVTGRRPSETEPSGGKAHDAADDAT